MYCYDYDPATGKYTFAIMNTIRVLGVATALALGTFMFVMVRRDRRMARATGPRPRTSSRTGDPYNHVGLSSLPGARLHPRGAG